MESHLRPRARRRSSLGCDPRGDTGGPALATIKPIAGSHLHTIPATPSPTVREHRRSGRFARARRKVRRFFSRWKRLSFRHTWVNPLLVVLCFVVPYAISPGKDSWAYPFFGLSYRLDDQSSGGHHADLPFSAKNAFTPGGAQNSPLSSDPSSWTNRLHTVQYGKGLKDLLFVTFYTVFLSLCRESIMQLLLRPIAIHTFGIPRSSQKLARFMEQAYTAIYFSVSAPIGLYVMSHSPIWYFETRPMYEGFPHRTHSAIFKAYYLVQASYWMQQALVLLLQLEKPRKDFRELVAHHLITLGLIAGSYRYHFGRMGLAVYIIHDVSDFFLATSKVLNYLEFPLVGPFFFVFVLTWIYFRHYLMLLILYSVLTEFVTVGPFELDEEKGQYKYWLTQYCTFGLLGSLQAVNLFWLYLILRIAKNYVWKREDIVDTRSDDEGSGDEHEQKGGDRKRGKGKGRAGEKLVENDEKEEFPRLEVPEETPRRRSSRQRGKKNPQEAPAA